MSLSNFQIILDNPSDVFFTGHALSGKLIFTLSEEKRMRGIELTFQGEANVFWTESRGHPNSSQQYRNNERFMNQSVYLVGSPDSDITLAPGEYSYPFRYHLACSIPSSFESIHGNVRYFIKGTINRPWRIDNHCKRAFTVLCPLDLNNIPNLQDPNRIVGETKYFWGICGGEPLALVVSIPFSGFVPGQDIKAVVEVDNRTTTSCTVNCKLIQKVTYVAKCGKQKKVESLIQKQTVGVVFLRGSLNEQCVMKIPPLPSSFLTHCNCIYVTYEFQVRGVLSWMSWMQKDAKVNVPITIGNIPLRSQTEFLAPGPSTSYPSTAPTAPAFELCADIPPPSYEQCISVKPDDRNVDSEFTPKYPVFHFK